MSTLQDKHGQEYPLVLIDRGGHAKYRLYHSGPNVIARARYDHAEQMIVYVWVDPRYRRKGIAYAIVKLLWAQHPDAIGKFPKMKMSQAMHGFLTALMRCEGLDHCTPGSELRGKL